MKTIELLLEDMKFDDLTAISIVQNPAIEENFLTFSKETFAKVDEEKKILTGPAMIPDRNINRGDDINYIFSKETVEKCSKNFLKNNIKNFSVEHEMNVNDIHLIESWIVNDVENDKSKSIGFSNLTEGTWMVSLKVQNDELWDMIKNNMKGFSIEGYFTHKLKKFKKDDVTYLIDDLRKIYNKFYNEK